MRPDRLHVGFMLSSLNGGGVQRNTLNQARVLIARGHRADLVIPCLAGDYRAAIPRGARLYRGRFPHTDRTFLRTVRRAGIEVKAMFVNPIAVAWTGLAFRRKYPGVRAMAFT